VGFQDPNNRQASGSGGVDATAVAAGGGASALDWVSSPSDPRITHFVYDRPQPPQHTRADCE
jgi:hypothetical protein